MHQTATRKSSYLLRYGALPALAFLSQLATATTYWVSTAGSDSNPGTQSAPLRHLSAAALRATQPGDVVMVMDGTYDNEGVVAPNYVVNLYYSGAPSNPITFMAQNRGKVILDSMNTTTDSSCNGASAYFNLNNAAYIVIQGFVIQRGCDAGFQSNGTAHDITIRWNEIRYIANRYITDLYGRDGIYLNSSQYNFTFDGNIWHDIGRTGGTSMLHFDHGIYAHAQNVTVINNIFYNMSRGWSVQLADGAANWLIANNTFAFPNANNAEDGQIMFWGTNTNISIQNNIFYQPRNYAVNQYGANMPGCVISTNIVYGASGVIASPGACSVGWNNVGANPMFVNASSAPYDFHVQPGGPGIDAALNLSQVVIDMDNTVRPQGVAKDIGAYENLTSATGGTGGTVTGAGGSLDSSASSSTSGTTGTTGTSTAGTSTGGDITTGLIAHWTLSEGSSYNAYDTSGQGNNGIINNASWASGLFPNYLNFNGAGFVYVKESSSLELTDQLSVSFWISPAATANIDPRVIAKEYDWDIKLSGANRYPQFSAAGKYAILNYSLPLNKWHQVIFTYSGGTVNGYVDGAPVGMMLNTFTGGEKFAQWAYGLLLGTDPSLTKSLAGGLAEVRVYNRALSNADAAALYSATVPGSALSSGAGSTSTVSGGDITTGLAALWTLAEGGGTTANDTSGNGNTGAVSNGYWWNSAYGPSLWFNGGGSYIWVNESPSLEQSNALTVSFWLDPNANSNLDPRVITKLYDWEIKLNGASRYPQFMANGQYAILNYSLPLNTWHHITFTYSNGTVIGYVDGVAVNTLYNTFTGTGSLAQWAYGLLMGTDASMTNPLIGSLAQVRIYNRALSAQDVAALYAATKP
jgi:hypothetical protein